MTTRLPLCDTDYSLAVRR